MLWPLCALIAPWLLHASAFRVQRLENAETCRKSFMHFKSYYIQSGEPAVLKCPPLQYLHLDYAKASRLAFNLTWYKNESRKLLPEDDLRIQVQEGALWFFPTSTEDTGHYHCILRNSSYCLEVIISFSVVRRQDVSLPDISYQQHVFTLASEQIYCPDLSDFTTRYTDWKLKWYKNNIILPNRNTKFKYLEDTTFLQIEDVTEEDEGYFTCEMTFTHTGTQYAITRIIQLQTVEQEKRNHPIIVYPNRKTIAAALGSRLIIPCKVFTGYGRNSMTVVWWLANDSYIDEVFQDGRVKEGQFEQCISWIHSSKEGGTRPFPPTENQLLGHNECTKNPLLVGGADIIQPRIITQDYCPKIKDRPSSSNPDTHITNFTPKISDPNETNLHINHQCF